MKLKKKDVCKFYTKLNLQIKRYHKVRCKMLGWISTMIFLFTQSEGVLTEHLKINLELNPSRFPGEIIYIPTANAFYFCHLLFWMYMCPFSGVSSWLCFSLVSSVFFESQEVFRFCIWSLIYQMTRSQTLLHILTSQWLVIRSLCQYRSIWTNVDLVKEGPFSYVLGGNDPEFAAPSIWRKLHCWVWEISVHIKMCPQT